MRLDDIYNSTWGEVIDAVEAYRERKRREYQNLSVIAKGQALMTALYVSGEGKETEVYDFFPFWTQAEVKEMLLKKYKNMLLKNSD